MLATIAVTLLAALFAPGVSRAANPQVSSVQSFLNTTDAERYLERPRAYSSPAWSALLRSTAQQQIAARDAALKADPARDPDPNACTLASLCVGDPRLSDFGVNAVGIVDSFEFTARSGATLVGHVWASRRGPKQRPLIVIINGSLIGYEQGYWPMAQALAKSGFVVLTFDAQGEGASDQFGAGIDKTDSSFAGVPGVPDNGWPFYDGAEDALDFALSTPSHPYSPVPSRSTGTSWAGKQAERVKEGFDSGYDPLWKLIDPSEIGIAGHSYGAVAASYLAQADPRIKAVVAWDSLCVPVQPSPNEISGLFLSSPVNLAGVTLPLATMIPTDCFGAPKGPQPALRVPSLGISGDYVLPGLVQSSNPQQKEQASLDYTKAGVDSGQIVIQGATHADFVFDSSIPVLPATLRGIDLTTWYTVAWFDKYLAHDPHADALLQTSRWRSDAQTAAVDPTHDGNLFSQIFTSRLDIHLAGGTTWDCENLRTGCPGMAPDDRAKPNWGYRGLDTSFGHGLH